MLVERFESVIPAYATTDESVGIMNIKIYPGGRFYSSPGLALASSLALIIRTVVSFLYFSKFSCGV